MENIQLLGGEIVKLARAKGGVRETICGANISRDPDPLAPTALGAEESLDRSSGLWLTGMMSCVIGGLSSLKTVRTMTSDLHTGRRFVAHRRRQAFRTFGDLCAS